MRKPESQQSTQPQTSQGETKEPTQNMLADRHTYWQDCPLNRGLAVHDSSAIVTEVGHWLWLVHFKNGHCSAASNGDIHLQHTRREQPDGVSAIFVTVVPKDTQLTDHDHSCYPSIVVTSYKPHLHASCVLSGKHKHRNKSECYTPSAKSPGLVVKRNNLNVPKLRSDHANWRGFPTTAKHSAEGIRTTSKDPQLIFIVICGSYIAPPTFSMVPNTPLHANIQFAILKDQKFNR